MPEGAFCILHVYFDAPFSSTFNLITLFTYQKKKEGNFGIDTRGGIGLESICIESFYLYAHVYSFSAWMLYVCINFWAQIVLEDLEVETTGDKKDPDSISLDLSLDSGLGVFDAFFASLSMIIVSEVRSLDS